ncbi:MAG: hypothetical protein NPIRA04_05100 [Nitrospirales bacterium]|nr:MAG: hypothetical protein NPIRA04_05100 [Nitrospirales bacterium]
MKCDNYSALYSLLTKVGTLSVGIVCLVLIGWPVSDDRTSLDRASSLSHPSLADNTTNLPSVHLSAHGSKAPDLHVDLNHGQLENLKQLPGIGMVLAQRIVKYRQTHGHFRSVDELQAVTGIGERRIARIRPLVSISQDARYEKTVGS